MALRHRIAVEQDSSQQLETVEPLSAQHSALAESSSSPSSLPSAHAPIITCKFCTIAHSANIRAGASSVVVAADTEFLHQDELVVAIRDLHPAARLHLQVMPKEHIRDIRELKTKEHAQLLQHMQNVAEQLLQKHQLPGEESRLGFHVPPHISVRHLHLHVISGPFNNVWFGIARKRFVCCYFPRLKFTNFFSWWFKPLSAVRASLQNHLEADA